MSLFIHTKRDNISHILHSYGLDGIINNALWDSRKRKWRLAELITWSGCSTLRTSLFSNNISGLKIHFNEQYWHQRRERTCPSVHEFLTEFVLIRSELRLFLALFVMFSESNLKYSSLTEADFIPWSLCISFRKAFRHWTRDQFLWFCTSGTSLRRFHWRRTFVRITLIKIYKGRFLWWMIIGTIHRDMNVNLWQWFGILYDSQI